MATRKMRKLSAVWMLMAVLCLLLITPVRNISTLRVSSERGLASDVVSEEDSLTARIEEGKLSDMAELRHFLNATIEKSGSRTRMAQRFDEGSDALLRRDFALKPVNALRRQGFLEHGASRSPLSILTILDSVRLLN
ncbi:MAG: hypothetical protein UF438_06260 [Oribacterium sp.]|nr:hypothetical protein [Oribacterium sp.]